MSEMVERVARALFAANSKLKRNPEPSGETWDHTMARAAVGAVREHLVASSGPDFSSSEFDGAIAMIDEALK